MKKEVALLGLIVALTVTAGCVTHPQSGPYLTSEAFARAAARCHVVSQGVHHAGSSAVPYANYRIPGDHGQTISDEGRSRECLGKALHAYRFDFLGEDIPKDNP